MLIGKKLIISTILELDNKTPKQSHQFRVGRTGYIVYILINRPLAFAYEDGHGVLHTSIVKKIEENENKVTITTLNSVYVFNYIEEE